MENKVHNSVVIGRCQLHPDTVKKSIPKQCHLILRNVGPQTDRCHRLWGRLSDLRRPSLRSRQQSPINLIQLTNSLIQCREGRDRLGAKTLPNLRPQRVDNMRVGRIFI